MGTSNEERGLTGKRALQNLVKGAGIATLFGAAMLGLELGSYPTYNVLEMAPEGLACRLASVAHHDYTHSAAWLMIGTVSAMFACLVSYYENKDGLIAQNSTKPSQRRTGYAVGLGLFAYLPLMVAVISYFIGVVDIADFIDHSTQPALMQMSHPLDGYICPPIRGGAG